MVKTQRGHPKNVQLISAEHDWFSRLSHPAVTSTDLPTPAALYFSFNQLGFHMSANFVSKLAVSALM